MIISKSFLISYLYLYKLSYLLCIQEEWYIYTHYRYTGVESFKSLATDDMPRRITKGIYLFGYFPVSEEMPDTHTKYSIENHYNAHKNTQYYIILT